MSKTIILTGGTGLIGSQIFKRLTLRGDRVILFVRNPDKAKSDVPGAAEYVKWDALVETSDWQKVIPQADAVVHLAGVTVGMRWDEDYKKKIYDSRITSTRALVDAMKNSSKKPDTFISSSAVGYYGNQAHDANVQELNEDSDAGTDFLAKVCVDWEAEALKATALGIRVSVIRTGVVLSKAGGALAKMMTPFKLFVGGPIGSGEQWVSWIHLDDEVRTFLFALDNSVVEGAVNATAPKPETMNRLAESLGAALNRPSIMAVPKIALQALFGEAADVIAEGQRVIPKKLLALGFKFEHPDLQEAVKSIVTD
jgi:uncharacterized protein